MPETMHFDGPCPFLTCLKTGPHDHPVCPKCGALRYGNLYCEECQKHRPEIDAEIDEAFKEVKKCQSGKQS
jgi:hypothetical protein